MSSAEKAARSLQECSEIASDLISNGRVEELRQFFASSHTCPYAVDTLRDWSGDPLLSIAVFFEREEVNYCFSSFTL